MFLQFSISDAYARRDTRAQLDRALRRSFRVWWEGIGCGFPLLAPVLIAVAYEKLAQNQETDWDFAQDVLVTHGPPGVLNTVTGVCGLAAMLWLYGVAWHQPMADSIAWARTTIAEAIPSASTLTGGFAGGAGRISGLAALGAAGAPRRRPSQSRDRRRSDPLAPPARPRSTAAKSSSAPIDADVATMFAERRAKIAVVSVEGPRMLRAGNWRRAAELCRAWTELELANAESYRCLGTALQAQGYHQDAHRRVPQGEAVRPGDRTLDAAIDRSQKGIVADFLNRYRR